MDSSSHSEPEQQARIRQQEIVADLGQAALEGIGLETLLRNATGAIATVLDTDYCKVLELCPDGDELLLKQGVGWRDGLVGTATVPTDTDSQAGYTLISSEPIIVEVLRTETRFSGPELLVEHDVVSGISVVIGSLDDPWGVLGAHTTDRRTFSNHDATFLKNVANVLAEAIENEETKRRLRAEIAERKERERELARFKRAVEASGHAIYMTDIDGRITYVNSAFESITGYPAEEAMGQTPNILQSGEHDEAYYRTLWGTVLAGEVWEEEIVDRRKCGELYHAEQTIAPVTDENGAIDRFIAVQTDVTDRKNREEALEESNERLEQFAYAASHDLQEPLRMVSSYLQLLDNRYGDSLDEDALEYLSYAVDGADRMREMIAGLLEYSRVETAGRPFERIDLDTVADEAIANLRVQIAERNADITVEPLPQVDGDPNQLRQVFQNVLNNAIKYNGENVPKIDVSCERCGGHWLIAISDNGIGIEPDETDRVFEVFNRLHTLSEHGGTGIGLAISERITERHGGEIWAESEPGTGSTFYFTIPIPSENLDRLER